MRAQPIRMPAFPSVVVVDDHPVVRSGVGAWFQRARIAVLAEGDHPDVVWRRPGSEAQRGRARPPAQRARRAGLG